MYASGWPITLLLSGLLSSVLSSPVSVYTPAPPFPSQISPPTSSPAIPAHMPFPNLINPSPTIPPLISNSGESTEKVSCPLMMSPSTLVVRFGDPVKVNCSVRMGFRVIGWEVPLGRPEVIMGSFIVWSVENLTEWSIKPMCFMLSELGGHCDIALPLKVYKPPENVSISFVNHTGPMFEGYQYTLQCTVQNVAPVADLIVTFYRDQRVLGHLQSVNDQQKEPVTEIFNITITPNKDDNNVQYWCEARLELGPEGPQRSPVVMSEKITAAVLFGPQLFCTKQILAMGPLEQKNFTVEVEILIGNGNPNSCNQYFLVLIMLIQPIHWL